MQRLRLEGLSRGFEDEIFNDGRSWQCDATVIMVDTTTSRVLVRAGTVAAKGDWMDISDWRQKIDELDVEIVRLINKRAEAARAIGELKRTADLPVYEPRREQEVFDRVRKTNPGPLADAELLHVYERIIDVMRTLQRRDL
jgi:chorismate mutase